MNKQSLAPWYFNSETGEVLSAPSPHSNLSSLICETFSENDEARLIAAAPDLLAALSWLVQCSDPDLDRADDENAWMADLYHAIDGARAALARARVES